MSFVLLTIRGGSATDRWYRPPYANGRMLTDFKARGARFNGFRRSFTGSICVKAQSIDRANCLAISCRDGARSDPLPLGQGP